MNIKIIVSALLLTMLTGCGHQTDEEVLDEATTFYSTIAGKYYDVINSDLDADVIKHSQRLGRDYRTNSWWYNAQVDIAEIAPLHRAAIIITDDSKDINHTLHKLEGRMLTHATIYQKLHSLQDNLHYAVQVIRDTDHYLEEARVLEQRRLEQEQLDEQRRQRYAMETIAYSAARPVVVEKTTVITKHPCSTSCKPCTASCSTCGPEVAEVTVE